MTQMRAQRGLIDGILLLDKPSGLSSNAALQRVKRLFRAEKAGHTGTLDPLASGLLPICLGDATKFAQSLLDSNKRYTATIRFGQVTTTGDAEGDIVATCAVALSESAIAAALPAFTGRIAQVPPAHSALKFRGRNYYEYARAGIAIPRVSREVEVHAITLLEWRSPEATVDVTCGKGTYMRALAEDLGAALGCGAHLAGLRRTATGEFRIDDAVSLARLEAMDAAARDGHLLPVDASLARLARLDVDAVAAETLAQGGRPASVAPAGRYRAYGPHGRFLGLVEAVAERLQVVRLVRASCSEVTEPPSDANDGIPGAVVPVVRRP